MPVLLNDENTINTTISQPETINTSLPDINYIPGYKEAEAERRANEVVRQENEADRIALYEDIENKVETGYFDGEDGFSPVANVIKDGNTSTITITDKIGTTTASIFDGTDGTDGEDGQDGFSPTATVTKSGKVATITITDKDGTTTAQVRDGEDGQGAGDMLKSTYDTNDNGIVDNAEKVNNHTVGCDVPADAVFTDTTYTAGANISISAQNVISATDTTYTAGTGIDITNGVISNTQTSAEWGNITGDIEDQTDLKPYLDIVAGDSEETTEKASSFNETGVLSLKDYSIYGDTSQNGTPTPSSPIPVNNVTGRQEIDVVGKNLFDNSKIVKGRLDDGVVGYKSNTTDFSYTNNSITFTTDAAWRGVVSDYIQIKPDTNYIYSAVENLSANTYQVDIHEYDSSKQWIKTITLTKLNNTAKFTSDSNGKYIRIGFLNPVSGTYTINNPMFEAGNQVTTYEPYIGKQYEINLGKNLLDISDITTGGGITNNGDGSITLNGTISGGISYSLTKPFILYANKVYTLSLTNTNSDYAGSTFILRNGTTNKKTTELITSSTTWTPTEDMTIDTLRIYGGDNTFDNFTFSVQLEENDHATPYSLYKTPIELCKIGDYQDYIRKSTGKNLFDKDNATVLNAYFTSSSPTIANDSGERTIYIPCQPNTTYTISKKVSNRFAVGYTTDTPANGISVSGVIQNNSASSITITTGDNAKYICSFCWISTDTLTEQEILDSIQIEKGETATEYEPYGKVWYLHKEIGKVVLDGSENGWLKGSDSSSNYYILNNIIQSTSNYADGLSNYFINAKVYPNARKGLFAIRDSGTSLMFNSNETTLENWKTWLGTNNTQVYYLLANSTNTEITDTELISQLNAVELLTGLNQIDVDSANKKALLQFTMYTNTLDGKYNYLNDTKTDVIAIGSENEATKDTKLLIDTTEEIEKIKYKDETSGEFEELYVKALDSMPVGTQVEYTGSTIPTGWTQVSDYSETEIDTGKVWTENNTTHKIYRKLITLTDHPQTTSPWTKTLSLSNIDKIWLDTTHSQWVSTATGNAFQFPYYDGSGYVEGYFTLSNGVPTFNLRHNQNIWNIYLVVEYTKSS